MNANIMRLFMLVSIVSLFRVKDTGKRVGSLLRLTSRCFLRGMKAAKRAARKMRRQGKTLGDPTYEGKKRPDHHRKYFGQKEQNT